MEQDERVAVLLLGEPRRRATSSQTSSNRILMPVLLRLPTGRSRLLQHDPATATVAGILSSLEDLEGLPSKAVRLVHEGRELTRAAQYESPFFGGRAAAVTIDVRLGLVGGGGDGDQPDWTERGKIPSGSKRRGPEARAPDWHADPSKYAAKTQRDKLERGELVVAVGPFCVPCGKRFAKQTVYDAHLAGKKHLAALQRMGRDEEAMVCQLDVEAKRRKIAEAEESKRAATMAEMRSAAATKSTAEDEEAEAKRLAAREEKLRQRAALPMPSCVTATSVYGENDPDDAVADAADPSAQTTTDTSSSVFKPGIAEVITAAPAMSASELAAAASGTQSFSYTSGIQDGTGAARTNRFTSAEMAASHRKLLPGDDWFNVRPPTAS